VIEIKSVPDLKKIANGGQASDGIVRCDGAGVKVLSF
jgi:hypothetical protein